MNAYSILDFKGSTNTTSNDAVLKSATQSTLYKKRPEQHNHHQYRFKESSKQNKSSPIKQHKCKANKISGTQLSLIKAANSLLKPDKSGRQMVIFEKEHQYTSL